MGCCSNDTSQKGKLGRNKNYCILAKFTCPHVSYTHTHPGIISHEFVHFECRSSPPSRKWKNAQYIHKRWKETMPAKYAYVYEMHAHPSANAAHILIHARSAMMVCISVQIYQTDFGIAFSHHETAMTRKMNMSRIRVSDFIHVIIYYTSF